MKKHSVWTRFNLLCMFFIGIIVSPAMANYQSQEGRWMQQDPMQYVDGLNLYEYVSSRPVFHVDKWGLFSIDVIGTPAYTRNYTFDGELPGKGCIDNFWMSVALRPTPEEVGKIVSYKEDGGFSVLRKFARWKQIDYTGVTLDKGTEEATLVKRLNTAEDGKIIDTDAASGGGSGITDMTLMEEIYVSPYYSALIAKPLRRPVTKCCSKGEITIIAEFFLYAGKVKTWDGLAPDKTISEPEYWHAWWYTQGRIGDTDSLIDEKGERISKGTLRVDISWDCKNNVSAIAKSTVPYSSTGNLTRTNREDDWWKAKWGTEDGMIFPIKFH